VEFSAQDRHRPVGANPEEGYINYVRVGTPPQGGQTERAGTV